MNLTERQMERKSCLCFWRAAYRKWSQQDIYRVTLYLDNKYISPGKLGMWKCNTGFESLKHVCSMQSLFVLFSVLLRRINEKEKKKPLFMSFYYIMTTFFEFLTLRPSTWNKNEPYCALLLICFLWGCWAFKSTKTSDCPYQDRKLNFV